MYLNKAVEKAKYKMLVVLFQLYKASGQNDGVDKYSNDYIKITTKL